MDINLICEHQKQKDWQEKGSCEAVVSFPLSHKTNQSKKVLLKVIWCGEIGMV